MSGIERVALLVPPSPEAAQLESEVIACLKEFDVGVFPILDWEERQVIDEELARSPDTHFEDLIFPYRIALAGARNEGASSLLVMNPRSTKYVTHDVSLLGINLMEYARRGGMRLSVSHVLPAMRRGVPYDRRTHHHRASAELRVRRVHLLRPAELNGDIIRIKQEN